MSVPKFASDSSTKRSFLSFVRALMSPSVSPLDSAASAVTIGVVRRSRSLDPSMIFLDRPSISFWRVGTSVSRVLTMASPSGRLARASAARADVSSHRAAGEALGATAVAPAQRRTRGSG